MGDPPRRAAHTPYPRRGAVFPYIYRDTIPYTIGDKQGQKQKHTQKLRQSAACLDPPKIYHKNTISCKYIVCNNEFCFSDLYKI